MWLLSILSSTLFVIPIVITGGAYFGFEHQRILKCGLYCKHSGNETIDDPEILIKTSFCDKSYAISPPPGRYTCKFGDLALQYSAEVAQSLYTCPCQDI